MAEYIPRHPALTVAVALLTTDLPEHRPGVKVATKYPNVDPDVFVRIDRVGGTKSNIITDVPLLLFECWTKNGGPVSAEKLANEVAATLEAAQFKTFLGAKVRWWREGGIAPLDDPDKPGMSRWQVTGELALSVDNR